MGLSIKREWGRMLWEKEWYIQKHKGKSMATLRRVRNAASLEQWVHGNGLVHGTGKIVLGEGILVSLG